MFALLAVLRLPEALPGPAPWDARARIGAAVAVVVFLAALWGLRRLLDGAPDEPVDGGMIP